LVAFDAGDYVLPFRVELRNPGVTPMKTVVPKGLNSDVGEQVARVRRSSAPAHIVDQGKSNQMRVGGRTPPRLATTTHRHYGMRALRVNQAPPALAFHSM